MTDLLLGKKSGIDTSISLPAHPSSVSAGRRFVRESLRAWGASEFLDSAELVASELITNAVLHALSAPVVRLQLENARLRIEVSDTSRVGPVQKFYGTQAGTGRGILLVDELSESWGSDVRDDGKTVWCVFASQSVQGPNSSRATG